MQGITTDKKNFSLSLKITHSPVFRLISVIYSCYLFTVCSSNTFIHLTPLFTYTLSNFLELISNGRSERLAISFFSACTRRIKVLLLLQVLLLLLLEVIVVQLLSSFNYFAVNRKVHLPLLSHREHIKACRHVLYNI